MHPAELSDFASSLLGLKTKFEREGERENDLSCVHDALQGSRKVHATALALRFRSRWGWGRRRWPFAQELGRSNRVSKHAPHPVRALPGQCGG